MSKPFCLIPSPSFAGVLSAFVLLICSSSPISAQEEEIDALFDTYTELFSAGESEAIAKSIYRAPVQYAGNWGQQIDLTEEDVARSFAESFTSLRLEGWSRSVKNSIKICMVTDDVSLVVMDYSRYDNSGKIIPPAHRQDFYVVIRDSGTWRIIANYENERFVEISCS
jgi:hypothetical protein